jgi:ribosomal protein S18 acetylase RimI-like enzyme
MAEVREITEDEWRVMRDIRLAALREAPYAFSSTYDGEATCSEDEWRRSIASGHTFLAYLPQQAATPAGIAGCFPTEPGTIELVSMWVRPWARGRGAGEALVAAVMGWARAGGARQVHLWVTETNDPARRLYQRCGFRPTGERQALPSSPDLTEIGMACPL